MPDIQHIPVDELKPWRVNARTHSKRQVRQLADSIRRFGFTNPVLIDEDNLILAGHGRVAAARTLGLAQVPCFRIETMSDAEKRAYVLADNKLALNAGWDENLLAQELKGLFAEVLTFDLGVTGFSIAEIEKIICLPFGEESGAPRKERHADKVAPARCRPGDIWQLGPHRLICGIEGDPAICDRIIRHWEAQAKGKALRIASETLGGPALPEASP